MLAQQTKPAGGHRAFQVSEWKVFEKNTLKAFFSLSLPSGLVVVGCTYHVHENGSRWVSMPGKPYAKDDGTTTYANVIDFTTPDARKSFQAAALEAIDDFLRNGGPQ